MKSSGNSANIGSSVEPGLPKIVVIPWARKSSSVASRTVVIWRLCTLLSCGGGGSAPAAQLLRTVMARARLSGASAAGADTSIPYPSERTPPDHPSLAPALFRPR